MHDAVRLERRSVPTVTLCHEKFETAARGQARIMGLPSLKIVVIPRPKPGEGGDAKRMHAEQAFPELIECLTSPALVRVRR